MQTRGFLSLRLLRWTCRSLPRIDTRQRDTPHGRRIPPLAPKKILTSTEDLAINGAPPMFAEPLHVGRPNIGNRDRFLRRVNEILDRGWLSNNGPVVQE